MTTCNFAEMFTVWLTLRSCDPEPIFWDENERKESYKTSPDRWKVWNQRPDSISGSRPLLQIGRWLREKGRTWINTLKGFFSRTHKWGLQLSSGSGTRIFEFLNGQKQNRLVETRQIWDIFHLSVIWNDFTINWGTNIDINEVIVLSEIYSEKVFGLLKVLPPLV